METTVQHSVPTAPREGKALIDATRPFATERRVESWLQVASTVIPLAALVTIAARAPWWPARALAMLLEGLVIVRGFILYHDHMHLALLRNSPVAKAFFWVYGLLVLTPPTVWKQTHNYHHAHTAKIVGSHVGSYAMLTTDLYLRATPAQRVMYRVIRHPATITVGYATIFLYGMCVAPFVRNPRKNWDSALAFVLHFALAGLIAWRFGLSVCAYTFVGPLAIATGLGAYLFYAQHNFPDISVQPRETWSYTTAALESSSYMVCGPVMRWFTGNIGYHHVHHLNPTIPFYRLPDAMAAIPELQHPRTTSLGLRDIAACFKLKLWDPSQGRMVGYPD